MNIVITGSNGGLGKEIAQHFIHSENKIVGIDAVADQKSPVKTIISDMSNEAEVIKVFQEAKLFFGGGINVLINNAGVQYVNPIKDFPYAKWAEILHINLTVPFLLSKLFMQDMTENSFGRIINIGSVHSLVASLHKSAYVASKHGLLGLTKVIAAEMAFNKNATCNLICPGFIETPLAIAQIEKIQKEKSCDYITAKEYLLSKHLAPEFVDKKEICNVISLFINNPSFNGSTITIDRGWTVI